MRDPMKTYCPRCANWTRTNRGLCTVCEGRKEPATEIDQAIEQHARKKHWEQMAMLGVFAVAVMLIIVFINWVVS